MSMVAGEFLEVYDLPSEHGRWDAVVTCFFLDTAPDPVAYINLVYRLLRPGGWWINFGAGCLPTPRAGRAGGVHARWGGGGGAL